MPQPSPSAPPVTGDPDAARRELGGRRVGLHMGLASDLVATVDRIRAVGASAVQVFTHDPTARRARSGRRTGIDAFRRALADADVGPLAIHASYLVNLATPDAQVAERSREMTLAELDMARRLGARFLNVHIGSHRGTGLDAALERTGLTIARLLDSVPPGPEVPTLVLEDSAGQGDAVGVTMAELGAILDAAERHGADPARVGVCLDTAHLWGAGYALEDAAGVAALASEIRAQLGVHRLAMLHLNDSRAKRGSRADRHEHLGAGRIGPMGLRAVLRHPAFAALPVYLETHGMDTGWDAVNMDRVRMLLSGASVPG